MTRSFAWRGVLALGCLGLTLAAGCSPTVRIEAPDKPIRFDININITEQKRLEIDQELLRLIRRNPALFGLTEDDLSDISGSES